MWRSGRLWSNNYVSYRLHVTCSTAELPEDFLRRAGFEPAATCLKAIFWVLCAIFHGHFALVALLATPPLRRVVLV